MSYGRTPHYIYRSGPEDNEVIYFDDKAVPITAVAQFVSNMLERGNGAFGGVEYFLAIADGLDRKGRTDFKVIIDFEERDKYLSPYSKGARHITALFDELQEYHGSGSMVQEHESGWRFRFATSDFGDASFTATHEEKRLIHGWMFNPDNSLSCMTVNTSEAHLDFALRLLSFDPEDWSARP